MNAKETNQETVEKRKLPLFTTKNRSLTTIAFVVAIFVFVFLTVTQSLTIIQLRYQMSETKETSQEYENESKVLTEKLEKVGNDRYVEQKAREELGMVKSGEIPVKIYEQDKPKEFQATILEPKEKISIYMKDWYLKLQDYVGYLKNK